MTLLKILRSGQVTLPADLRKQFNLVEEDYLQAEATQDGILLKPVTVVVRQKAGKALVQLLNRVHARQRDSTLSDEAQEELIAKEVKASRKEKHRRHA